MVVIVILTSMCTHRLKKVRECQSVWILYTSPLFTKQTFEERVKKEKEK